MAAEMHKSWRLGNITESTRLRSYSEMCVFCVEVCFFMHANSNLLVRLWTPTWKINSINRILPNKHACLNKRAPDKSDKSDKVEGSFFASAPCAFIQQNMVFRGFHLWCISFVLNIFMLLKEFRKSCVSIWCGTQVSRGLILWVTPVSCMTWKCPAWADFYVWHFVWHLSNVLENAADI